MGVAFSQSTIVFNTAIDGSSVSSTVAGLLATFGAAGWTGSAIAGGFEFGIESPAPQSLQVKVKVWDDGSGYAAIQLVSVDGARVGFLHHLFPGPGLVFQCWANICQFFISVAGKYKADPFMGPWFAAGGIPSVPLGSLGSCGVDAGPTLANEIWWSCGDGDPATAMNFRLASTLGATLPQAWSACYNGDLMVASAAFGVTSYSEENGLRLLPVGIALPWPHYFGSQYDPRTIAFGGADHYRFDPLLAWGSGAHYDGVAQQKGQLWDCYQGSVYAPVDDIETRLDSDGNTLRFVNYMGDPPADADRTRFSSLYLLVGSTAPLNEVPFMY